MAARILLNVVRAGSGTPARYSSMSAGTFEFDMLMREILSSRALPVNKIKLCVKRRLMAPHVEEGEGD